MFRGLVPGLLGVVELRVGLDTLVVVAVLVVGLSVASAPAVVEGARQQRLVRAAQVT